MAEVTTDFMTRNPPRNKLEAFILITRPIENLFVGLALVVAYFMAKPPIQLIDWTTIFLIFIAGYFISAQGMVHNDIVDLEIDRINCPHRALPSEVISVGEAWIYFWVLSGIAVGFSVLIDLRTHFFPYSTIYATVFMVLIDMYNKYLKRSGIWGNAIIGFSVGNLFIYADLLVNHRLTPIPTIVASAGFIINIGREIIKGMTDIKGDKELGVQTVAVVLGEKKAAIIGSSFIIVGLLIILSPLYIPSIRNEFHSSSIILLVIISVIMFLLLLKLWKDISPENAFWVKERIFYVMFTILIPFALQMLRYYF